MPADIASGRYSLGVLIGGPFVILGLLAGLLLIALGVLLFVTRETGTIPTMLGGAAVIAFVAVLAVLTYWPLDPTWHKWYTTSGTIQNVSSRIISDGNKSVNQRFVVQFTDGRLRSCDDTRCSLLRPGDQLDLSCKRSYQFAGTSGWDCNYIGSSKDRAQ